MRGWIAAAALLALVIIAWANSLAVPFHFDDAVAVERNPSIRQLWPLSVPLSPPAEGGTTTGRPVVNLSLAVNHALGGEAVWGYHAVNVALHAGSALLLLGLARRVLGAAMPAFFLAALWSLHPLQTESVTGIAQRTESLCGFFYLLTLYAFVRGTEAGRPARWWALAVAACLLGMGSKEVMVTAPLVVLLYDRCFVAGSFAEAWRRRGALHLMLAATWGLLAWLVFSGGGTRGTSAGLGLGVSWWSYLLKQCEAIVLYLRLSVWPHPLVLDYGTAVAGSAAEVFLEGLLVLALLGATLWALVRRPSLGFAGAWFFLILAPSSSFVPLVTQTMAEHRMYLPLAAPLALGVWAIHRWAGARAAWILGALTAACLALTIARNHDYRSPIVLWQDSVDKWPASARAQLNLGVELRKEGQLEEAIARFAKAASLQKDYASAHYQWGAALLEAGRTQEAVRQLGMAVLLAPRHADALLAHGNALLRVGDADGAVAAFRRLLDLAPAADAHFNLGVALSGLGREAEAEAQYRLALRLDPGLAPAHRKLGLTEARRGALEAAATHFQAVIAAEPADADAMANLGNVRLLQNRPAEALRHFEAALRLRPGDARLREALELAREAARN